MGRKKWILKSERRLKRSSETICCEKDSTCHCSIWVGPGDTERRQLGEVGKGKEIASLQSSEKDTALPTVWFWFSETCGGGLVAKLHPSLVTPWTVAHQAPLSMGLSRIEHWSGLPFPSPQWDLEKMSYWLIWKMITLSCFRSQSLWKYFRVTMGN